MYRTLSFLFAVLVCSTAFAQVPIVVQERAGIARVSEPVTLGVPLARGVLMPATPVRIVDSNSTPVDAQFRTMSVWDDGSIRWLKCDFQATVAANSTSQYQL